MSPFQAYFRRVLDRWRVIVAVTVVGAVLSTTWAFVVGGTKWTATAALTTQSQTRAPEQDAVLALGYVDYFNQNSYQELLTGEAGIPAGVKLMAKTGATSPILYIEAEGSSEDQVRSAASLATDRFRNDVRDSLVQERDRAADDLQKQIDIYVESLQRPERTQAEVNVILDQIRSLQGRLTEIKSDNTNLLKPLQSQPGVASATPSKVTDIAAGTVGALVLGVLIALLLVVLDRRLRTAGDVRHRLGIGTVAEFDRGMSDTDRARRVENLANSLSLVTSGRPVVVVVVSARRSPNVARFAHDLAISGASRRSGTLLVVADLRGEDAEDPRTGLVDVIDRRLSVVAATSIGSDGLSTLRPGRSGGRDPHAVFEPDRLGEVVREASTRHGLVVIIAPPVLDASESQVICSTADHVLVVADRGVTRWVDVRDAVALLRDVNVRVTAAVLDDKLVLDPSERDDEQAEERRSAPTEILVAVPAEQGSGPVIPAQATASTGATRSAGAGAAPRVGGGRVLLDRARLDRNPGSPTAETNGSAPSTSGGGGTKPSLTKRSPTGDSTSEETAADDSAADNSAAKDEVRSAGNTRPRPVPHPRPVAAVPRPTVGGSEQTTD